MGKVFWTDKEDEILKEFYITEGPRVYKRFYSKTQSDCIKRAERLGLMWETDVEASHSNMRWTKSDIAFLRANYSSKGPKYCAEILGRTVNSCTSKASALKLKRSTNGETNFDVNQSHRGCSNAKMCLARGTRIGRLTLIYPTKERNVRGEVMWRCRCSCGEVTDVASGDLRKKTTLSCGCLRRDLMKLPKKERKQAREEVLNGMR